MAKKTKASEAKKKADFWMDRQAKTRARLAKISPSGEIGIGSALDFRPARSLVERTTPRLDGGCHITTASMVVDLDGICWWIDPQSQTIRRVT